MNPNAVSVIIQDYPASAPEFADCMAIRIAVFVREQHVALEEEQDEHDATARHFLAVINGQPAGTARLLSHPDGADKIGRVAVLAAFRGTGTGAALMRHAETFCTAARIELNAQTHALGFYQALGYEIFGEPFLEAGIAHRHMRKWRLPAKNHAAEI